MAYNIIPVAVSGGAGTRLWPLSTESRPEQFHALSSDLTLLQATVTRLAATDDVAFGKPILVCNRRHAELAQAQMAEVDRPPAAVVLEPFGRNTAAVAVSASLIAESLDPEALVLLMPSDHLIRRPEAFAAAVAEAAPLARDRFVLFGVVPSSPETGYGYIETGEALQGRLRAVARFVEKPDFETARAYLAGGRHLWNAGIFLFSPRLLLQEMARLAPDVARCTRNALGTSVGPGLFELQPDAFAACPSISLDYAVMEHTDRAAVLPLDAGWADIGSWNSIWEQGPHDASGNMVHGETEALDCEDCLIWAEDGLVAAIGLRDLVVVRTEKAVMVLPKSRAQDIKSLVERLKATGRL
ncbi:MAG: mannose-1-phosphate guanylyltransferase/mannose-6-phosphate isomerase [Caulobacteraceae bacterium]